MPLLKPVFRSAAPAEPIPVMDVAIDSEHFSEDVIVEDFTDEIPVEDFIEEEIELPAAPIRMQSAGGEEVTGKPTRFFDDELFE